MAREHVVSTGPDPLQAHPCPGPDDVGIVQTVSPGAIRPGLAVKVDPWDRQAGDEHGDASEEEDGASNREESSGNDEPVLVEENNKYPDREEGHTSDLSHLKSPGDVRDIVQDDVWQRRVLVHIRNSVMDYCHGQCCQP